MSEAKTPSDSEGFSLDLAYLRDQAGEAIRTFLAPLSGVYEAATGRPGANEVREETSFYIDNHSVAVADLPLLISNVHNALSGLGDQPEAPAPAVSIRSSVKPDYIVCLEDGKKLKMLKRHLMTHYNLTPDQYRQKWGLNADYPMVAPNYAEQRQALAKKVGLGTKRRRSAKKKADAS